MSLLDIIIFLPLIGALAILAGAPARCTALGATGANFILGLLAWLRFDSAKEGFQLAASRTVVDTPAIRYAVGIDGLGLVMLMLSVIVSLAAVWMAPVVKERAKLYFVCLLLIAAGALGAFCSTDVFFFYAFHELALIPTFLMIGIWGSGKDRVKVAWKITIYLAAGSVVLLAGLIALQFQLAGPDGLTFSFAELQQRATETPIGVEAQKWIFLTLLIGFGILISLFPFHSWAAPAYASAPAPTTMLHAGILKKFGLYGLIRFLPMLPEGLAVWRDLLVVLLLGNILFVGFVTLSQRRLDTMLGNSSVMHMGYIFLGIASWQASGDAIGLTGAVILMFAHGVSIALLFGLCGKLKERMDTVELDRLGGLGKGAPMFAFLFGLAAFASIGLPGFANFSGEILVFFGGFDSYDPSKPMTSLQIGTILALWGVVISAVYMLRAYRSIFLGRQPDGLRDLPDIQGLQRAPLALLVVALLIIGIYPKLFSDLLPF